MQAAKTYGNMILGRTVEEIFSNFAGVWRELVHESQLRWVSSRLRSPGIQMQQLHNACARSGALTLCPWEVLISPIITGNRIAELVQHSCQNFPWDKGRRVASHPIPTSLHTSHTHTHTHTHTHICIGPCFLCPGNVKGLGWVTFCTRVNFFLMSEQVSNSL